MGHKEIKIDEAYLAQRIAQGDREAYSIVFRMYYGKVNAFLSSILKSRETAEELTQEVFYKIWCKRRSLASVRSIDSYLYISARNAALDCFRKAARRKQLSLDETLDSLLLSRISIDPDARIDAQSKLSEVKEAVNSMPAKRRDIFLMSRFDGLSNDEISSLLGISKKTIENQLALANNHIKKLT